MMEYRGVKALQDTGMGPNLHPAEDSPARLRFESRDGKVQDDERVCL